MDRRVAVAASGGRDSTALLHTTVRAAAPLGIRVVALHVHHGLSTEADAWLARLRRQALRWGAGFDCRRLEGGPTRGDSVEAWARAGRYAALTDMARAAGCDLVLIAHHRRDQAETFLLQALRGAGARGLAAMPALVERDGIVWSRPWLDRPRDAIEAYVRSHRLAHVEDPSNGDIRFARNRLRLTAWPSLTAAFPQAESVFAAASRRSAEQAMLADEVGAADLPPLLVGDALGMAAWQRLTPARRRNALRAWLTGVLDTPVLEALVQRLMTQAAGSASGTWQAPGVTLRTYRGLLTADRPGAGAIGAGWHAAAASGTDPAHTDAEPGAPGTCDSDSDIDLSRPGRLHLREWSGILRVEPTDEGGAGLEVLRSLSLRRRIGGERFSFGPNAATRCLKKQYQARAVPAWQRSGPLLFSPDGRLVFVPGLGIEAGVQAAPGVAQMSITWLPSPGRQPDPGG